MLDCVLISRDDDFRRQVQQLSRDLDSPVRLALDVPQAADELHRDTIGKILHTDPHVAFLDLGETTTGVRVIEALNQDAPDIGLIVGGPQLTAEALLDVIRAGATEYLPRPLGPEDVAEALSRVRRRLSVTSSDEPGARGRITTVFSAKGGTGVTVTAANLAVLIQGMTRKSVLLLDLNAALGTAALTLGLQPRYSYLDVIRNFHRIDEELLRSFLEVHESGVAVLASPPTARSAETPTPDQIVGLLRFCRRHFSHIVVDGGSAITGPIAVALGESDERLLVTTPDLPTLRNLKKAMELVIPLGSNGTPAARMILNKYQEGTGVSIREVEDALGLPAFETLERDDDAVTRSLNTGHPVALSGKSRISRGLIRIGGELAGPDRIDEATGGVFDTLLRPFRSKNR